MRLAFGELRLAPHDFWRMSPVEFQAALDGYWSGITGMEDFPVPGRDALNALYAQFPDTGAEHATHG